MLKITHIIGKLNYGGAEKLLFDLCRFADKEKIENEVIVLRDDGDLIDFFEEQGIKIKVIERTGKFDWRLARRVADYLKVSRPDIVHTHLFEGDFWGAWASFLAGIKKTVSTKHDSLSEGFWRDLLGRFIRKKRTKVIAISEAIKEFLLKKEKIKLKKIALVRNGVDIEKFYSTKKIFRNHQNFVIGSVGRLAKEKGYKYLLRACRFLHHSDWRLILVGDGLLKQELQVLAEDLGISSKVEFVGQKENVQDFLSEMDVFVLPSLSEGLSLVLLEAGLSGKFVVASAVGGIPEIIEHQKTGLLFPPKNIEKLTAHLNWAWENKEQAQEMAVALRESVRKNFNIKEVVKKYQEVYENIINQ